MHHLHFYASSLYDYGGGHILGLEENPKIKGRRAIMRKSFSRSQESAMRRVSTNQTIYLVFICFLKLVD